MERKKFWQIVILLAVFVISVSFPVASFSTEPEVTLSIRISIMTAFIIFAILYLFFTKIAHFFQGRTNIKNTILLSPLFFIAFCNLFFMTVIKGGQLGNFYWTTVDILNIVLVLLVAFSEELVFRYVIQKNLVIRSKVIKIFIASAIFALCHIFTIIANWNLLDVKTWNWFDLSMIVYTFFIGVVLGFLYEYTNNIVLPIAFHFIFNFINSTWFYVNEWNWEYLINILCFAAFGVAYICLFYFVFTKKENR